MAAEEQFEEVLAAMRKAQADVVLFLEEKEQAALSQANGIQTYLEHRSAGLEKSKQELHRIAAISNTVLFLEVGQGCRWMHACGWGQGAPLPCTPVADAGNVDTEPLFDEWEHL